MVSVRGVILILVAYDVLHMIIEMVMVVSMLAPTVADL